MSEVSKPHSEPAYLPRSNDPAEELRWIAEQLRMSDKPITAGAIETQTEKLVEQLEAALAEAELKRIETHHANAKRQSIEEQLEATERALASFSEEDSWADLEAARAENKVLVEQLEAAREALRMIDGIENITGDEAKTIAHASLNSNPASSPVCECGHLESTHYEISAQRSCRATVYTDAPLGGGSAYPCPCRDYVPASEPDRGISHGDAGISYQDSEQEGA